MDNNSSNDEDTPEKIRDAHGQFTHVFKEPGKHAPTPHAPKTESAVPQHPVSKFLSEHTHYNKQQDDLLDVHIGNPLRKITHLLEEIKKQKAFSFTLKGSLGVMGIVLVLSTFGILGGNRLLCDKGTQTQMGVIKILHAKDQETSDLPFIGSLIDTISFFFLTNKDVHARTVLQRGDGMLIHIPYSKFVNLEIYKNQVVLATGAYDSCSQILTVNDPTNLEVYR